jgi:fluoride exporter
MSPATWLGVAALGGVGATARFLLDGAVSARAGTAFPWGTLAVNVTGSFALGVVGANVLFGTGLIGAYTTFSTWMLETHRLAEDGRRWPAVLNVVGSLAVGLPAAWLGRQL